MEWKLNSLWAIEYEPGDTIGQILSHISMMAVMAPFIAFSNFLATKSIRSLRLGVGLILCTLLARGIKMVVNSPRPDVNHISMPGNSGFPSDHSMSGKQFSYCKNICRKFFRKFFLKIL